MSASAPRAFPRSTGRGGASGVALALAIVVIGVTAGRALWRAAARRRSVAAAAGRPAPRPVDAPLATAVTTSVARSLAPRPARRILLAAGGVVLATSVALAGAGTTYALWNGETAVNASTVTSGSTSLSINGTTDYAIPLDLTRIGPGQSVWTPLTIANTGTTPLSAAVSNASVITQSQGLADSLALTLTQATTCTANLGGVAGQLSSFTTSATPYLLPVGSAVQLCLEISMNADAPETVQGGAANFTLTFDAVQVR